MSTKFCQLVIVLALISILQAQVCRSNQFSIDGGLTCTNCSQRCTTCTNLQFCSTCVADYYLVNNGASVLCRSCSQIYRGCLTCLTNVACTVCDRGYYLENTVCIPCSNKIPNCFACTAGAANCTACNFPYVLTNSTCTFRTVQNPTTTTVNTTNTTNGTNSSVPTTVTLFNGTVVTIVLDSNGCNQIQIFIFATCLRRIQNCRTYLRSGLCQACNIQYVLTVYGVCAPDTRILRCQDGFWLNSTTNTCIQVSISCDWYYENNGSCFNCSTGYNFVNSSCVANLTCNQRQYFSLGSCVDIQRECTKFTRETGRCTECRFGFRLSNGFCSAQPNLIAVNNCAFPCKTCHWSILSYCFSCLNQYQLVNSQYGSCTAVIF